MITSPGCLTYYGYDKHIEGYFLSLTFFSLWYANLRSALPLEAFSVNNITIDNEKNQKKFIIY